MVTRQVPSDELYSDSDPIWGIISSTHLEDLDANTPANILLNKITVISHSPMTAPQALALAGTGSWMLLPQVDIEEIRDKYNIINPSEVEFFIRKHHQLIDLLKEMHPVLEHYFPGDPISAKVENDPEIDWEYISVRIQTQKDVDQALESLDSFTENWWLDNLDIIQNQIVVNVEFR